MTWTFEQEQPGILVEEGPGRRGAVSGDRMICKIRLGDRTLALQTSLVQEVIASAALVKVPLAPPFLAGLATHRGGMLSIVSLRSVLGFQPERGKNCVVVLRADPSGGECFGLLVDEVLGVLTLAQQTLEKIPPTASARAQEVFRGMYLCAEGPLGELNVDHLRPEWLGAESSDRENPRAGETEETGR